jgi:hypothetical protein
MKARIGGIALAVVVVVRFGGCGGAGSDEALPISTPLDAGRDQPGDVPEGHAPGGLGGAQGMAGSIGSGGTPGVGGATGSGGSGGGGSGVGGIGVGVGGIGDAGAGVGGAGVGGAGVGGTGVGGAGVGGTGVGGIGVGGTGVGGTGVGGTGVGGTGVGGDVGTAGSTGMDGAVDAPPATLTQIWTAILGNSAAEPAPGCVTCHDGSNTSIPDYTTAGTSFTTLVNAAATSCPGTRVIPGSAAASVLVNKLRAKAPFNSGLLCGGAAMPKGNRSITPDQLQMIEQWINAGALNN